MHATFPDRAITFASFSPTTSKSVVVTVLNWCERYQVPNTETPIRARSVTKVELDEPRSCFPILGWWRKWQNARDGAFAIVTCHCGEKNRWLAINFTPGGAAGCGPGTEPTDGGTLPPSAADPSPERTPKFSKWCLEVYVQLNAKNGADCMKICFLPYVQQLQSYSVGNAFHCAL